MLEADEWEPQLLDEYAEAHISFAVTTYCCRAQS